MELASMNFINYDPASINQLNRKRLKTEFKKLIEDNNIDKLEYLLSNDFNLKLLKREKYLDPYVVAIKSNNLGIFDYLSKKGFKIKGILAYESPNKLSYSSKKRKLDELNPIERPLKKSSSIDLNRYNSDSSAESECNEPQSSSSSLLDDDQNAKSSLPNYSYSNALIEAIKCLNYDATKLLINLNVNVNSSNYKYVPLQIAYNIYSKERDKFLLNQKYDQYRLETSLKIFKLLLTNKADPNIYNSKGYRLIHQITLDKDFELLELLINTCGASLKVNCLTYGKMQNALHLVTDTKRFTPGIRTQQSNTSNTSESSNEEGSSSTDDSSSEQKYEVNWTNDKSTLTELNLKLAKLLIDSGCNMHHKDYHAHETPIFKAIVNNNYELIKLFVIEGVDMSIRNLFGNDTLSRSIQLGRFKIARLLIVADSPIRVYSCFYKIPSIDDLNRSRDASNAANYEYGDQSVVVDENFLQYSISKYEEFLVFLQKYTQEPRSLVDLCRLCVRNQMKKPISKWLPHLGRIPSNIVNLIMLKDIDKYV